MNMNKKSKHTMKFHIGDILGVMTGIACEPNSFRGVCEVLTFMTGESPYTTQAGRFAEECRPYLAEQFPQFAEIKPEELACSGNAMAIDRLVAKFGAFHEVRKMHPKDHVVIDVIEEFKRDFPNVPMQTIEVPEDEE